MSREVGLCFLLRVDAQTSRLVSRMGARLEQEYPALFTATAKDGQLPHHMTIFSGKVARDAAPELVQRTRAILKPFQSPPVLPKIEGMRAVSMPLNYLGVWLQFVNGSYIMTGDKPRNRQIAHELNPSFNIDLPRQVSIGKVEGGKPEMQIVMPAFARLFRRNKGELLRMTLTPEVWVKEGSIWLPFPRPSRL